MAQEQRRRVELARELNAVKAEQRAVRAKIEGVCGEVRRRVGERDVLRRRAEAAKAEADRVEREVHGLAREVGAITADRDQYMLEIAELRVLVDDRRAAAQTDGNAALAEARTEIAQLAAERDRYRALADESARRVVQAQERILCLLQLSDQLANQRRARR
jgi:chromosome segregation ATPase